MKTGDIIKILRNEKGLTQAQLGEALSKGDSTVRMWELGRSQPDNETLRKIASIFDVSTDYLLGKSTIRNPLKAYEIIKEINPELYETAIRATDDTYEENLSKRKKKGFDMAYELAHNPQPLEPKRNYIKELLEPIFTDDEVAIIEIFRCLNDEGKKILLNTAKGLSANNAYMGEK